MTTSESSPQNPGPIHSGARADIDLLELARTVEQCVPHNLERALDHLRMLSEAVDTRQQQARDAQTAWSSVRERETDRLRSVLTQLARDLAGGHVLAVCGLERQVKRYLDQSSGTISRPLGSTK